MWVSVAVLVSLQSPDTAGVRIQLETLFHGPLPVASKKDWWQDRETEWQPFCDTAVGLGNERRSPQDTRPYAEWQTLSVITEEWAQDLSKTPAQQGTSSWGRPQTEDEERDLRNSADMPGLSLSVRFWLATTRGKAQRPLSKEQAYSACSGQGQDKKIERKFVVIQAL